MKRHSDVEKYDMIEGGRDMPPLTPDGRFKYPMDDPCPAGVDPLTTAFGQYIYYLNVSLRVTGRVDQGQYRELATRAARSKPPMDPPVLAERAAALKQATQPASRGEQETAEVEDAAPSEADSLSTKVLGFGCRQWNRLFAGKGRGAGARAGDSAPAQAQPWGILEQREAREAHLPNNGYAPPFSDDGEEEWRYA